MSAAGAPNEEVSQRLIGKLNQFRSTLDSDERRMLDAVVVAARQAHEQGDVTVYWFTPPLGGSGVQAPGVTTNIWSGYGDQGTWQNTPFG
jgi:hypothetical protein